MKKFLACSAILFFFSTPLLAQIEVSSFTYFQQLYNEGGSQNIYLTDNIIFSTPIGNAGPDLNLTIDGRGHVLDGNSFTSHFDVANSSFIVKDIKIKNIKGLGAITASNEYILFEGSYIEFSDNSTFNNGGALRIIGSNVIFNSSTTYFINNSASLYYGGAIILNTGYWRDGKTDLTFNGNAYFTGNSANIAGGILIDRNATLTFNGNETVFNGNSAKNSGGAIGMTNGGQLNFNGDSVSFISNSSVSGSGALYLASGETTFNGRYAAFINNYGGHSGAISAFARVNFNSSEVYFYGNQSNQGGAISLYNGMHFDEANVTFLENKAFGTYGGAMFISGGLLNSNLSTMIFNDNIANDSGGGIYAANNATMNFYGSDITFTSNTAVNAGGAIAVDSAKIVFTDTEVDFSGNSADIGGAIYAVNHSTVSFSSGSVTFSGNVAASSGGAVFADNTSLTFDSQNTDFIGNKAGLAGGAAYLINSRADFSGKTNFRNNTSRDGGGALSLFDSIAEFNDGTTVFSYNRSTVGSGGAIYASGSNSGINFNDETVTFQNNSSAFNAGAISVEWDSIVNFNDSDIIFSNNYAYFYGGAIEADFDASINFVSSDVKFIDNNVYRANGGAIYDSSSAGVNFEKSTVLFEGNYSTLGYGGAIEFSSGEMNFKKSDIQFLNNSAKVSGGAIHSMNGKIFFNDSAVLFSHNLAEGVGGAVCVRMRDNMCFTNSGVIFVNNSAAAGAAISMREWATLTFNDSTALFSGNTAKTSNYGGGAIHSGVRALPGYTSDTGGTINFIDSTATFINNTADATDGGAVWLEFSSLNVIGSSLTFSTNSALNGGAIYAVNGSTVSFSGGTLTFTGNVAASSGGAVYLSGNNPVMFDSEETSFTGNRAVHLGGAIYSENQELVFTKDALFKGNIAALSDIKDFDPYSYGFGGALALFSSTVSFSNVELSGNYVDWHGGAIYAQDSLLNFNGNNTIFSENTSNFGGGVYLLSSTLHFNNGNVQFSDNNSYGGGVITAYASKVNFINSVAKFSNNLGGSLYATEGASITFTGGSAAFENNTSGFSYWSSGVIVVESDSNIEFNNTNTVFSGNYDNSLYFNGVFSLMKMNNNASLTFNGGSTEIRNNYVNFSYINSNSKLNFNEGTIKFINNEFEFGLGIFDIGQSDFAEVHFNGAYYALFSDNMGKYSGVLSVSQIEMVFNGGRSEFINNSSQYVGGVARINGHVSGYAKLLFSEGSASFIDNSAQMSGGAIDGERGDIVFENVDSIFSGNISETGSGGAIHAGFRASLLFDGGSAYFSENIAYERGGAISADLESDYPYWGSVTEFSFRNMDVIFENNKAVAENSKGGAIFSDLGSGYMGGASYTVFEKSNISFNKNQADYGGAAYFGYMPVDFVNSDISFSGNSAKFGGAMYIEGGANNFTSSTVTFAKNSADYGGAIYLLGNTSPYGIQTAMNFIDSDVYFISNTARVGSAIYAVDGSSVSFIGGKVTFQGNISTEGNGAAIFVDAASTVTFTRTSLLFLNNESAGFGGSYYLSQNNMDFDGDLNFFGNKSAQGGGAFAVFESGLNFNNAVSSFNNNQASSGGALYSYLSDIKFDGGKADFKGNTASESGGAIYAVDDLIFNNIDVVFDGNEATAGNGGAVFSKDTVMTFKNAAMLFINNQSLLGGAVYADDNSDVLFDGKGTFEGNTAIEKGGALYVMESKMSISASGGDIRFGGNTANGKANDIYLAGDSLLSFDTKMNNIILEGGILSDESGGGIEVYKAGSGTLYLGGQNEIWGNFKVLSGDVKLMGAATYKGNNLVFENGSLLDMMNGAVNIVEVDIFEGTSGLKVEIFADGSSDKIYAEDVSVGGDIYIKTGVGVYDNTVFEIVTNSGNAAIAGVYNDIYFTDLPENLQYSLDDSNGSIKIIVTKGIVSSAFSEFGGLSKNQKNIALALDNMSIVEQGGIINIINSLSADEHYIQKKTLSETSGYFISNIIRSAALDSVKDGIYERMNGRISKGGIWAQVTGGSMKHEGDLNSLGEYKDNNVGIILGADKSFSENKVLGVYAKYNKHDIEQRKSEADLDNFAAGLYGGYIKNIFEVRASLNAGYDKYETKRYIAYSGQTASGDFNGFSAGADAEGSLDFKFTEMFSLRPYLGIDAKNVSYEKFKEKGAGSLNLDVDDGNYFRSEARAGLGIGYTGKVFEVHLNGEAKYLLSDTESEIDSVFEGTNTKFTSTGYEDETVIYGAGIGVAIKVFDGLNIYAGGNYYCAEDYQNISGNTGIKYSFGK